jgi:hypothetical protein
MRLQQMGVSFNNVKLTKVMLMAVNAFDGKIDTHGRDVLHRIERLHGREVMTSGYYKLWRIIQLCQKETDCDIIQEPATFFVNFFLEYVEFALRFGVVNAKDITADWIDKTKDGIPGMLPVTFAKLYIMAHVSGVVQDLEDTHPGLQASKDLVEVMKYFVGYPQYELAFPVRATNDTQTVNVEGGDDGGGILADPVEDLKAGIGKAGMAAIDFFYDLYAGAYDNALRDAMKAEPIISKIKWNEVGQMDGFKEMLRQLLIHKATVKVTGDGDAPPPTASRALTRHGSDDTQNRKEEINRERTEVWQQARVIRRKLITVAVCRFTNKMMLDQLVAKLPVSRFSGKPAEAHRAFLFSADMFQEVKTEPWNTPCEWSSMATVAVEWMLAQKGPSDVLVFLDGRSRSCRAKLEAMLTGVKNLSEVWIVYKPSPRLGRKVSWGSDNREVAFIVWPINRSRIPVKERSLFAGSGEASTHDSTYTGVEPIPWQALPCISAEDKAKVVGYDPEVLDTPFMCQLLCVAAVQYT